MPDLDAIMFLKPRKSKIDIAQAVGRVMRKSPGKDYGYVILPIGVPAGSDANAVLDNNEKYRVVWEVLNALRSLDERFDATINKLELNKKKPEQIQIIGVGAAPKDGELKQSTEQLSMMLSEEDLSDLERAIYGKIVRKVGNTRYWEDWSKDVAEIAQKHMLRIKVMLEDENSEAFAEFQKFLKSLRYNINDSISESQAIEMLAQHLITKPVFEALFDTYSFVMNNPVSKSMDKILAILDDQGLMKEQEKLESFYESVRVRAEGIDNLKAKQDIIIQLYDKFFKVGFKETTERLGIVFTPTEVVDFIIHSVDDVLKKHFNKSLASEGVHILDPFTGTGTFVTRLLQSGLIPKEDLLRKYTQEIHANEIVLLSYYIAAINIEETFHSIHGGEYVPFEGIVLTDTFESTENKDSFMDELFDENNARLKKQQEEPIFAIIGNPPYNVGQTEGNNNVDSIKYPNLDYSINKDYAETSKGGNKKLLYDSYIRAFKWASERIKDKGIIGFVTNGSFIDSASTDGLRKSWYKEFNHIYVFNLRGDQRTQGETSRKEGGKIFGSGSRTPIAITFLVKDDSDSHELYYNDIGDYLTREQKLSIIVNNKSIEGVNWLNIKPDKNGDWINQRDDNYQNYYPMFENKGSRIFLEKNPGVKTHRDSWVYNFSKESVEKNAEQMIDNVNSEIARLKDISDLDEKFELANKNNNYIKWSDGLKRYLQRNEIISYSPSAIKSMYRPFTKKWLYYNEAVVEMTRKYKEKLGENNLAIYVTGNGSKREFSAIMIDSVPCFDLMEKGQGFLLNNFEENLELLNNQTNISESAIDYFKLNKKELFYYIYGVLHSKEYRENYSNDLKKSLPKIPLLKNKEKYIEVGKKLSDLHLNYENADPYKNVEIQYKQDPSFKVKKMKHIKRGVLDTIIFNNDITISKIPLEAYSYVVNGRSAIEWIMDQYQVKIDSKTGIVDDPNMYLDDEKYIFNLLLKIINVSLKTVELVNSLPQFELE